jgi:glycosyltransferase involved in cell wall biosynthesis
VTERGAGEGSSEAPPRPRIALAIRHYNNAPFVEAALASAFAQTYAPLDIVFVDDASSDGGYEIAQRLAAAYRGPHRVIVARNERNVGLGEQNNRILALSRGEIIVFLDADDIALPERCEKIWRAFREGGPGLLGVVSYFDLIDAAGRPITGLSPGSVTNRQNAEDWSAEALARERGGPSGAVAAFRREIYERGVSLAGLRQSDDLVIGFRCLLLGRLATLREALVLRRVHLDNMSGPMRPGWSGKDLAAWHARYMREKVLVPGFMRRDIARFARAGLIEAARAGRLDREVRLYARELKLLRVAPRLPAWRGWTLYFALRRLGTDWRRSIRLTLQAAAPSLAMMLLRRNAVIHRRAAMEAAASASPSAANHSASRRP